MGKRGESEGEDSKGPIFKFSALPVTQGFWACLKIISAAGNGGIRSHSFRFNEWSQQKLKPQILGLQELTEASKHTKEPPWCCLEFWEFENEPLAIPSVSPTR